MARSLLMLSLPNSGSTWLAELIAKHTPWDKYAMEYFNPIRTPQHYGTLARQFGCELVDCYRNIAKAGDVLIDSEIQMTWGTEKLNFTKEVFSPYKLEAFTRHFDCFVLLRNAEDTFPPKRARVWSFYEHAWFALCAAGLADPDTAETCEARARAAHEVMTAAIRADAERLAVPVLEYRDLFEDKGLRKKLETAIGEFDGRLLTAIQESRRLSER